MKIAINMKVLIVGAGPVGLTCSHLLSRLGISNTILERNSKPPTHPSAHLLHSRTMEIFETINVANSIYSLMPPTDQWRKFIYCSSIRGTHYRVHDHFLSNSFKLNSSLSHFLPVHLPQYKLVSLLASILPNASTLLLGEELIDFSENNKKIFAKTSKGRILEADYLIGCDGSGSTVRRKLGIQLSSTEILQSFLNIHFKSKQLGKLCKDSPAMIYFIYNKETVVVMVMHNSEEGEFVLQVPDFPPLTKPSDYNLENVTIIVNNVAGTGEKISDIEIKSIGPWKMSTRSAKSLRTGNVFLAGDAAHALTPAGSLGINTGISDVHNLAWKLKFPELLSTYETERLPRIQEIIEYSLSNYERSVKVAKSFGLNINLAKSLASLLKNVPFGNRIFKFSMKMGQKMMLDEKRGSGYVADEHNLLDLLFPNEDLMFRYKEGFLENGGELGSNHEVEFEGKKTILRLLPGILARDQGKCEFVRVNKPGGIDDFKYPCIDVQFPGHRASIIRPDGHVYWSE